MADPALQNENALLLGQKRVLERVATGAPLADTLAELISFIEAQEPCVRCGILIVTDDGAHFRRGSGPNLPEAYHRAFDGAPITPPYLGPCSEAAHRGVPVVVPDIANDARWAGTWRDLAMSCGLAACHSMPVRGSDGKVLASFAIYYDRPCGLRPAHPQLIEIATHLAVIALERQRADEAVRRSQQDLEDFFENGTVGLHWVAGDGTILRANRAELDLLGYRPEEYIGRHIAEFHADPPVIEDILKRLSCGERLDKYEARLRAKDGTIKRVLISSNVRFCDGRFVNTRCFTVDVTEHKQAEEALRESEEFNRRILQSSRDCVKVLDLEGRVLSINACGLRRLEVSDSAAVLGTSYVELWHGDDRRAAQAAMEQALADGTGRFTGFYRTPSGKDTWWDVVATPILDADGKPERLLVVSRDITERKRAEERSEVLMAELNHRVKNTLATVQSLAASTLGSDELTATLTGRLAALAHAHGLLAESKWDGASLAEIIEAALAPYRGGRNGERVAVAGADVRLWPKAAQTLSLALHELATNAAKYGALSVPEGRVAVSWKLTRPPEGERLMLRWVESGGPPVKKPDGGGFGSKLIEYGIAYELDGETRLEYRPAGLRCTLTIPLSAAAVGRLESA